MRFEKEMKQIAYSLETQKGYSILQCIYASDGPPQSRVKKLKQVHYAKIDLSDGIYVINMDGYIGTAVSKEIEYAQSQGKEIIYHCNL